MIEREVYAHSIYNTLVSKISDSDLEKIKKGEMIHWSSPSGFYQVTRQGGVLLFRSGGANGCRPSRRCAVTIYELDARIDKNAIEIIMSELL